jgi:hypothetical protein
MAGIEVRPYLTEGNRQANGLAFDCAKQSFQQCAADILPEIKNAVRLQVHLIKTFYAQSCNPQEEGRKQVSGTQESCGFTPRCSCVPGSVFVRKEGCYAHWTCPASQSLSPVLNVEHLFLNHVQDGAMVPFAISPGEAGGFLFPGICNSCAVFSLSLGTFCQRSLFGFMP